MLKSPAQEGPQSIGIKLWSSEQVQQKTWKYIDPWRRCIALFCKCSFCIFEWNSKEVISQQKQQILKFVVVVVCFLLFLGFFWWFVFSNTLLSALRNIHQDVLSQYQWCYYGAELNTVSKTDLKALPYTVCTQPEISLCKQETSFLSQMLSVHDFPNMTAMPFCLSSNANKHCQLQW